MARPTLGVTGALAVCGIVAALSGVTAATTVVSFKIHDGFPLEAAGVRSDGNNEGEYSDYRIDPLPPLNRCVDAAPYSQGLLFVRLNRKMDGDAGVLHCSDPDVGGIPRNVTLTIDDQPVCDLLAADLDAGLLVTDAANVAWNTALSTGPCTLARIDNLRIRLDTLYKARAKTTTIHFQTEMFGYPASYVIQSDAAATITGSNLKDVRYTGNYHLVRFAPGVKPKTVGPPFYMPVQMTFWTSTAP